MRVISAVVLALCASACQPTNRAAIEAAKPAWAQVRASLPELEALMGQEGTDGLAGMNWVELDREKTNVSFLTGEQLKDPDFEFDSKAALGKLDLFAGGDFLYCLQWTGPRSKMSEEALGERNGDRLGAQCEAALQTKYLVVLQTTRSELPRMTGEGTFEGGQATVRVTVIDRLAKKLLASFIVEGQPGQVVKYELRPNEEKATRMAVAVHSTMWSNARQQLFERLRARGARIEPR